MTGNKPDELLRTPMQWTGEVKTGFTTGVSWQPANASFKSINVAAQDEDKLSLLNHYRSLVHLRNEHTAANRRLPAVQHILPGCFILSCGWMGRRQLLYLPTLAARRRKIVLYQWKKSLSGEYEIELQMGSGEFGSIVFDENESTLDEYVLPEVIEPWSQFILSKLQP